MVTVKVPGDARDRGEPGGPGLQAVRVREARPGGDLDEVRALFREYAAALDALGAATCMRGLDRELEGLPGEYAAPRGCILVAEAPRAGGSSPFAGAVALRPWTDGACEMKRLYVRPAFRDASTGRALAVAAIAAAETMGYDRVVLDTLPAMTRAIALYRALGFQPIPRYNDNPDPGALFLARGTGSGR